jgi:hypothetical protein
MGHGRYLLVGSCSFLLTDFPPLNRPKKLTLYVVCSEGEQREDMGLWEYKAMQVFLALLAHERWKQFSRKGEDDFRKIRKRTFSFLQLYLWSCPETNFQHHSRLAEQFLESSVVFWMPTVSWQSFRKAAINLKPCAPTQAVLILILEAFEKYVSRVTTLLSGNHKVLIYIEHHSVCPLVGIGTPPPL